MNDEQINRLAQCSSFIQALQSAQDDIEHGRVMSLSAFKRALDIPDIDIEDRILTLEAATGALRQDVNRLLALMQERAS